MLWSECALSELLFDDDLVLMIETIDGLRNMFLKSMDTFLRKVLKVNLGNTKVMVSSVITKMACLKVKLIHVGSAA